MTEPSPSEGGVERLLGLLEAVPEAARQDEHLLWRGRYVTLDLLIAIEDRPCFLPIVEGRPEAVETRPQKMRATAFTIAAPAAAWQAFWEPMPRPGWHDLFAMNKRGHARIEGNLLPFMQNLQYFKDLLALPRRLKGAC